MMDTTNQGEVAANPLYSESETEEDNSLRDEMEAELTLCLKKTLFLVLMKMMMTLVKMMKSF